MENAWRRIVIGLITLAVVLGVYLIYVQVSENPEIEADAGRRPGAAFADPNVRRFGGVGRIADVGIVAVRTTRFFHRNKQGQVDREFGFKELLYEYGDQWEIDSPYMNIYLPKIKCLVTADVGKVRVESTFGQPFPTDATFAGNVTIHLIPTDTETLEESFIYLDDVSFASDRSMLSTPGPVEFVSASARLKGEGFELVYDDTRKRLELFHIIRLESLAFSSSKIGLLSSTTESGEVTTVGAETGAAAPAQQDAQAASVGTGTIAEDRGPADPAIRADGAQTVRSDRDKASQSDLLYRCTLEKNVTIRTPDEFIFAKDELTIRNVLWSGSPIDDAGDAPEADPNQAVEPVAEPTRDQPAQTITDHLPESDAPQDDVLDIVITCDGGVLIAPMDIAVPQDDTGRAPSEWNDQASRELALERSEPMVMVSRVIDLDYSSTDMVMDGPAVVRFDADLSELLGTEIDDANVPIMITAQDDIRYVAASHQIAFFGDCVADLSVPEPNAVATYTALAPTMIVGLHEDPNAAQGQAGYRIGNITALGAPAKLRMVRKAEDRVLRAVELEASSAVYDLRSIQFAASGPGMIKVNNAEPPKDKRQLKGFGLRRPCYAFVHNFDILTYSPDPCTADVFRLTMQNRSHEVRIDYFPIVDGKQGRQIEAVVGRIDAKLRAMSGGQTELVSLEVTEGITYDDGVNQFVGGASSYDYVDSVLHIRGGGGWPCYLNGSLVEGIELNLETEQVKARLPGPGAVPVGD